MKKTVLAALCLALSSAAFAQNWPVKPIRVLVGFAPGGTADVSARMTGDIVSKELGQPVIIENRPGGSGSVGIEALIRGPADGYTLFVGSDSSFYQPVLNPKLAYRAEKDLKPVTILTYQPIVIVVHPAPGWRSIGDLIKAAKARPGQIAYALSSPTGTQAVAGGMFFKIAGVKLIPVAYKGGGQAIVDLISGQIPVAVLGSAPVVPQVQAGRIKVLAVTSKTRSKVFPDVPTLAEQGFPQIDLAQWFGVVAPAGVPNETVTRVSAAFNKALSDPKIAQRLFDAGLEVVGGSPSDMTKRMAAETVIWSKAAKEAGLAEK
ncbi:MAG TPA: tripartite tricarboxylate transporter substrate binding protein [Burkholderiales bacterium]|nr:tripartite tricarboxylate transporter substrate binding protein [Burkholderiales bacterium]